MTTNKRIRQYVGLLCAILSYYVIHEGAHLIYALATGTFKRINFIGLGVQIDVYAESMTDLQLGIFCLAGSVATLLAAYALVLLSEKIGKSNSKPLLACAYYVIIAMLLIDPLYLSVLCGFFGGGDMNGISLLLPEVSARVIYGVILVLNVLVFVKIVLPKYKTFFTRLDNTEAV